MDKIPGGSHAMTKQEQGGKVAREGGERLRRTVVSQSGERLFMAVRV